MTLNLETKHVKTDQLCYHYNYDLENSQQLTFRTPWRTAVNLIYIFLNPTPLPIAISG